MDRTKTLTVIGKEGSSSASFLFAVSVVSVDQTKYQLKRRCAVYKPSVENDHNGPAFLLAIPLKVSLNEETETFRSDYLKN